MQPLDPDLCRNLVHLDLRGPTGVLDRAELARLTRRFSDGVQALTGDLETPEEKR